MFDFFLVEYNLIFFSLIIVLLIALLPFCLSYFINYQEPNVEKLSAYECGFQPFEDSRQQFNIEFYLVGILFIIFDLEIVFLFPCVVSVSFLGFFGISIICVFLFILTLGFIFELLHKSLDW